MGDKATLDLSDRENACRNVSSYLESILPYPNTHPNWGKEAFLRSLNPKSRILDLGCGNQSPSITKAIIPDCYYIGIDVGNYNQPSDVPADEYLIVSSARFAGAISYYNDSIDAVISSHNIEHCEDRYAVVAALAKSLKIGGKAYISFPTYECVNFPHRRGTLNYYDDGSHITEPPDFGTIVSILTNGGLRIIFGATRYQPPLSWIVGLGTEEVSNQDGVLKDGTWAYWGFETIIWAERIS